MIKFIKNFRKDDDGAVTVDWVVLTAAVVALAGAAYGSISSGSAGLTANIATELNSNLPDTGL
jgi:Flp pilus assembly pilin Flp